MRKMLTTVALAALMVFAAPAAFAQEAGGKVTVIHGIPGLTVDVYVNGDAALEGFEPGDVAGPLDLPAGDYELAIAPAGEGIEAAVLEGSATVTDGLNASIIANLDADGNPTISIFVNDTSEIEAGNGRLVVRHLAAAPVVDILLADGTEVFTSLANGDEAQADVPAGTYDVEIAPEGAGVEGSVYSAPGVEVPEGTARIVYATGDFEGGSFGLIVQDITGLHGAPAAVNTGSGDLAGSGMSLWVATLLGAAVLTLVISAPRAIRRTR